MLTFQNSEITSTVSAALRAAWNYPSCCSKSFKGAPPFIFRHAVIRALFPKILSRAGLNPVKVYQPAGSVCYINKLLTIYYNNIIK